MPLAAVSLTCSVISAILVAPRPDKPPACLAGPGVSHYTSKANVSYYLNTSESAHAEAEATCAEWGGHLVIYSYNNTEQLEVEGYFVSIGALIPSFHELYWMGLRAVSQDDGFQWLDRTVPALTTEKAYVHWGQNQPRYFEDGEMTCAGANSTLTYGRAWGWAAANCTRKAPYICMKSSRWRGCIA